MVRYMTNFLSQYFSIFLSIITALRELQSLPNLKRPEEVHWDKENGIVNGIACCKREVWGQDHTPVVLSYGEDTASVIILFLINLFLCRESPV